MKDNLWFIMSGKTQVGVVYKSKKLWHASVSVADHRTSFGFVGVAATRAGAVNKAIRQFNDEAAFWGGFKRIGKTKLEPLFI